LKLPVLSIKDVAEATKLDQKLMIKTVVFSYRQGKQKYLVCVALPAEKQVNKMRLAELLGINSNILRFASEKQITQLGFPIGGIAPFGFQDDEYLTKFLDKSIWEIESEWLYMGVGDNTKTLKITKIAFLEITKTYQQIAL